ncbi:CAAX prenyl protease-like protein [Gillisia sp. Hel_I_86]|uniref:CPBP family intramembrane glutamic endopeptidase n=1 Tax=Gillisia sp. Hel_I_86 TaxID=1249981 RepID=UPI00119C8AC3|nr:CPBP family intramembrane glutamic endopeptidase [Gillisia sp. Hel_I_86]TVZ28066.1 CAAX prenyl protease-like protein [Gillisia sp. Hel_I_86]
MQKLKLILKDYFGFFILTVSLLIWKFNIVGNGGNDFNGFYPKLSDFGFLGILLPLLCCLFLALNASNALNKNFKENYIKILLFEKAKIKWYVIALLFFPLLYSSSFIIGKLLEFETTENLFTFNITMVNSFLLVLLVAGGSAEFGWRGFLQKELQKKYNPLLTASEIAFFWALWNLPLHYNGIYSTEGFFHFLPRFITTFQLSILFTWLYNKYGFSILAAMILYSMTYTALDTIGRSHIPVIVLGILMMFIFIFDNKMWKRKNYADEIYSNDFKKSSR